MRVPDAEVDEQDVEVSEDDGEVDELDVELSQDDTEVNELDMEVSEDDAEVDVELDVDVRYAKQRAKQMRADAKKNAKEPKKTSATVASRKKRSPPTAAQTTNATRRKASEILIGTSASERGVSVSGIGESDTQQEGERAAADAVAITPAKLEVSTVAQDEIRVERVLNSLLCTGRDDVGFAELQQELQRGGTIMSVAAIETVLACMEAANKVMHRESRIYII